MYSALLYFCQTLLGSTVWLLWCPALEGWGQGGRCQTLPLWESGSLGVLLLVTLSVLNVTCTWARCELKSASRTNTFYRQMLPSGTTKNQTINKLDNRDKPQMQSSCKMERTSGSKHVLGSTNGTHFCTVYVIHLGNARAQLLYKLHGRNDIVVQLGMLAKNEKRDVL